MPAARRTLEIYRQAADSMRGHASSARYRGRFRAAIRDIEAWLAAHALRGQR
jgi:hypothetical protein